MVFSTDGRGRSSSPILAFAWLSDAGLGVNEVPKLVQRVRQLDSNNDVIARGDAVQSVVNFGLDSRLSNLLGIVG